jgi:lipopolysaccharide transport system permease protein
MPSTETMPPRLPSADQPDTPTVVIEPVRGWSALGLRDVWAFRELLFFMIWREIQGTYRQTALGTSWLFVRPVANVLLLTFVFGGLVKVSSDGLPYPLFSLAALLPWGFFSNAVTRASRSLVDNMQIISKVYFPRLLIPLAGATSGIVDFAASFLILLIALALYQKPLRLEMLWIPVLVVIALGAALAVGLWLATLSVKYRDVSFAVTFLLQALMYASPVIYSADLVPGSLRLVYHLNPMTGVIQGFRWALYGSNEPPGLMLLASTGLVIAGIISGAYVFRRTERTVVDIL